MAKDRLFLARHYAAAVRGAGGAPVMLLPVSDRRAAARQLRGIDGLILTGADDYRPSLYGEKRHPSLEPVPREKERYDLMLCAAALARRRLPILAICGGMQLLVIVRGGRLHVHVEGHDDTRHGVAVEPDSRLFRIAGRRRRLVVNSFHHQAVAEPGRGLRSVAFSPDGLIEAVEGRGTRFLAGVQWHPERMKGSAAARLFRALVRAVQP